MAHEVPVPESKVLDLAREILSEAHVLTLATTLSDGAPHANNAFFAFKRDLRLYFVSDSQTRHSLNIARSPRAAATVYPGVPVSGAPLRGLQLAGTCSLLTGRRAVVAWTAYLLRFPPYKEFLKSLSPSQRKALPYHVYEFVTSSITLLHEPVLGDEKFVTVDLHDESR